VFARIVACVDASPAGRRAAGVGIEMAERFKCALTLLHVAPRGGRDADLEALVPAGEDGRSLADLMAQTREDARLRGAAQVEVVTLHGEALDEILGYLHRHRADLVVVGTRGLSRGSRMLLGSVSSRLVNEAPCPVLVVRPHSGARS
jgi:nucleotide-binding universal stress UspA family protein